jgi:hypothetical protein
MNEQQKKAIEQAQAALVAALDSGVEEDALFEAVFAATVGRDLQEISHPSQERMAELLTIMNKRVAYDMKEFSERCHKL